MFFMTSNNELWFHFTKLSLLIKILKPSHTHFLFLNKNPFEQIKTNCKFPETFLRFLLSEFVVQSMRWKGHLHFFLLAQNLASNEKIQHTYLWNNFKISSWNFVTLLDVPPKKTWDKKLKFKNMTNVKWISFYSVFRHKDCSITMWCNCLFLFDFSVGSLSYHRISSTLLFKMLYRY